MLNQLRDNSSESNILHKIGLYTSPHLRFVRERIQIDGQPLSEEDFTKYFFEVWDRLEASAQASGVDPQLPTSKPVYFRFLTLMAFHTYKSLGVAPAIIECGIGGAYDSTNVLTAPSVTAITNLGIDHVGVLGGTIQEIAWHKAGIMKTGITCLTPSSQPAEAKPILEQRASEIGAKLVYVDIHPSIASGTFKLGLQGDFQRINASLALAVVEEYLKQCHAVTTNPSNSTIAPALVQGLAQTRWPGRCQILPDPVLPTSLTWHIDGGHTLESLTLAAEWFASCLNTNSHSHSVRKRRKTFLIFNQQTRAPAPLILTLHRTLCAKLSTDRPFDHVFFTTNTAHSASDVASADQRNVNVDSNAVTNLTVQNELAETWKQVEPNTNVRVTKSIEEAVDTIRHLVRNEKDDSDEVEGVALVTGSLHLVGGLLEVLEGGSEKP